MSWQLVPQTLFVSTTSGQLTDKLLRNLADEAKALQANQVLLRPEADLIDYLVDRYRQDIPKLLEDKTELVTNGKEYEEFKGFDGRTYAREVKYYVFGIPFEGDSNLFNVTPSVFSLNPPAAHVLSHELQLKITLQENEDAQVLQTRRKRTVQSINENLDNLRKDFGIFNAQLRNRVSTLAFAAEAKASQRAKHSCEY